MKNDSNTERWVELPGFPGFRVSDLGSVVDPSGRPKRAFSSYSGHLHVVIHQNGVRSNLLVSRAVLLAFVGQPPTAGMHAAHENGKPTDNRLENLAWKTPLENMRDKQRHGTQCHGVQINTARLTPRSVRAIVRMLGEGKSIRYVARHFGIGTTTVGHIRAGRSWRRVTGVELRQTEKRNTPKPLFDAETGEMIAPSIHAAEAVLGCNNANIYQSLKTGCRCRGRLLRVGGVS